MKPVEIIEKQFGISGEICQFHFPVFFSPLYIYIYIYTHIKI